MKVYGQLNCSSAMRAVAAGTPIKNIEYSSLTKPQQSPLAIDPAGIACVANTKLGGPPKPRGECFEQI